MELPNRPVKDPYQELPIKDYSYVNTQKNLPKKRRRAWLYTVSGVVILVLLGAGAFAYGHYTKNKPAKKTETSSRQQEATTKSTTKTTTSSVSIPMTSYTSSTFSLTLNYPTSWSLAASGNTLTISSPTTSLVADTGKTVNGRIVLSVVNQGQIPAGFGSGSVAVLNSQDLSFSKPTSSQAAQTYLSFVQYPATSTVGGMDAIYVTGNNGYLKDQAITSAQVNLVSPLIYVAFQQCSNQACTSLTALTISSTMWSNDSFSAPILDTIKSLSFN